MTYDSSVSETIAPVVEALEKACSFELDCLRKILQNLDVPDFWLEAMTQERQKGPDYHRVLLYTGKNFEIVLAVWPVGTATLIHNHGASNSFGMVKVLKGKLFNDIYDVTDNGLVLAQKLCGEVNDLVAVPLGLVHQMGNAGTEELAASLHVYSPAITDVCFWDPNSLELCNL